MPSETAVPNTRKRKLSAVGAEPTTVSSPPPPAKRRKQENQRRHRTPSWFWDNLSRLWLTPRALREFDRRTVWSTAFVPSDRTGKEDIDLAQLKRFARHGGPSLGDLRAYPEPGTALPSNRTMASSQSGSRKKAKIGRESDVSSKTRKSSAYDPDFEQHLIDHGVYPEGYNDDESLEEPANLKEINHRLAQPRLSLSPSCFSSEAFLDFKRMNRQALTKNKVISKVFPIIAGTADTPSQENLRFGNLKDLTDGSITKAQPDLCDGTRLEEFDKQVREELGPYIVPSTNTAAPCLPNFFTEGKGPKGLIDVCKRQALYDGALGARAILELRSYVDPETAYDNNAYTITSTYHPSGLLTTYTTHPVESSNPKHQTEYRMTQLNSYAMTGTPDGFRQGAAAWRNARDLTRDVRKELIAAANRKALNPEHSGFDSSMQSLVPLSSNEPTHPESETSTDELAVDNDPCAGSTHKAPVGARIDRGSGRHYGGLQKG